MSADLLKLAERCEAATGPDRELDALIWLHLPEQEAHAWKHGGDKAAHAHQIAGCGFVPRFTASLDAAMTLVPEGCSWVIAFNKPWQARIDRDGLILQPLAQGCATPALALTAACLRALTNEGEGTDD